MAYRSRHGGGCGLCLAVALPVILMLLLVPRLTFAQVVSDEFPLVEPTYGLLGGTNGSPELEWGEAGGLAVWSFQDLLSMGIRGSMLSGDGRIEDPYSKEIFTSPAGFESSPCASWNGESFLVVWSSSHSRGYDWDIQAARLSPEGVLLDGLPIQVSPGFVDEHLPSVAWDGTSHLVVWLESGNGIRGSRVSPDGTVLDQTPLIISSDGANYSAPEVEWNGADYFVVWSEDRGTSGSDVFAARVDSSGLVLDPGGSVVTNDDGEQVLPALAWNGSNFLVVWQDDRGVTGEVIQGALVTPSNEALGPFPVSLGWGIFEHRRPEVASDGTDFLVAWERHRGGSKDVVGALVSDDGQVLEPSVFEIAWLSYSLETSPSVTWTGNDYLVAWEDTRPSGAYFYYSSSIYSTRVSTTGEVLDHTGNPLSMGLSTQVLPSVASNGEDFFAVWTEEREGRRADIFGTHLESGVVEPGYPSFPVSSTPMNDWWPSVAWDGERYLAVWGYLAGDDTTGIYGARVTTNGSVFDTQTDLSRSGYSESFTHYSDVACHPGSCLVVFEVGSGGALLRTDGLALQPQILDLDSELGCGISSIVSGRDEYMAVCTSRINSDNDVVGFWLSFSGEVIDSIEVAGGPSDQSGSDLAWGGNGYFVVWKEGGEIRGARVNPTGIVLDPGGIPISGQGRTVTSPAISWGGMEYLVAWLEEEDEAVWNLVATRVSEDGVVLDAPGILLVEEVNEFNNPAIAADGSGRWLVGYSRFDWSSEDPGHRVFGRFFSSLSAGVSCSVNEECRSTFCADGVCCDGPCDGQCEACDADGLQGTCSPVEGEPRGGRTYCPGAGVCRSKCDGSIRDSCIFPGDEKVCADAYCAGSVLYEPATCAGNGYCGMQAAHSCEPYACGVNRCNESCVNDQGCAGSYVCINNTCQTLQKKDCPPSGCGCGFGFDKFSGLVLWMFILGVILIRRKI
ncbi:MAG: hypothetical protein JRJ87_01780 [Deltaproteobacteria bacterium]|nr:hypothetical protein [Deltaproteobacteria bacterium]